MAYKQPGNTPLHAEGGILDTWSAKKDRREAAASEDPSAEVEATQRESLMNRLKTRVQESKVKRESANKRESAKEYIAKATHMMDKEEKSAWKKQNAKAVKQMIDKYGSVEAAKAKRAETWTKDRPNTRMELRNITVASEDDVKATGVGYGAKAIKEKMWVKKEILPHGGGERDLSYSPAEDPDKKKEKRTFSDWRQMRQAIHKEKVRIKNNPKYKNLKDGGFRDEKNQYGFITPGSKNRIKIDYGFMAPYMAGEEEGSGPYSGFEDESAPSGKARKLAIGGGGLAIGSFLISQLGGKAKSIISGKPAQNTKTPYSNVNPTQQDLLSGRGKIIK